VWCGLIIAEDSFDYSKPQTQYLDPTVVKIPLIKHKLRGPSSVEEVVSIYRNKQTPSFYVELAAQS